MMSLAVGSAAAGDTAFVTCQNGGALAVIDLEGDQTEWALPGQPAGVAVGSDVAFTVSADSKEIRRFDTSSGAVLARTTLEGGPIGVALDALRGRVFVSDWYNARIWVLNSSDLSLITELPTGAAPAGLALSDDGRLLASADRDSNQVSIFDAQNLSLLARHPVGERPYAVRFAPDGRLWAANVGSDDVTVVEPERGASVTVPVGDRPYGIAFAQGRAFVTNQYENTLSVFDLDNLTEIARIDTGEYPEGIDNTADQSAVVLVNWFDNTAMVIDALTLETKAEYDTCDGPRAFGEFLLGGEGE